MSHAIYLAGQVKHAKRKQSQRTVNNLLPFDPNEVKDAIFHVSGIPCVFVIYNHVTEVVITLPFIVRCETPATLRVVLNMHSISHCGTFTLAIDHNS